MEDLNFSFRHQRRNSRKQPEAEKGNLRSNLRAAKVLGVKLIVYQLMLAVFRHISITPFSFTFTGKSIVRGPKISDYFDVSFQIGVMNFIHSKEGLNE